MPKCSHRIFTPRFLLIRRSWVTVPASTESWVCPSHVVTREIQSLLNNKGHTGIAIRIALLGTYALVRLRIVAVEPQICFGVSEERRPFQSRPRIMRVVSSAVQQGYFAFAVGPSSLDRIPTSCLSMVTLTFSLLVSVVRNCPSDSQLSMHHKLY